MRWWLCGAIALLAGVLIATRAPAQEASAQDVPPMAGLLELHFTPVRYAQLAIWLERADGTFVSTLRLTEAVAYRGIGNRPGASEMNSGFRWPYGRREGVLPIWATRRASAPGAKQWKRVIFQNRVTEGLASRTSDDQSPDNYYCLSFDQSKSSKDALDAVSCASQFSSDKGRFLTDGDVSKGYGEPYEQPGTLRDENRVLSLTSLYPPRRDVTGCAANAPCNQHPDVAAYAQHARDVMPDIDAVSMATPVGGEPQQILYALPEGTEPGDYRACIEINVEGDYNETYNDKTYPTPAKTPQCTGRAGWDYWALCYGYPYRGQPSVVYCNDIHVGDADEHSYATDMPAGSAGTWDFTDPSFGALASMSGMTDDPVGAPGSGADRLQLMDEGYRFKVVVKPPLACNDDQPPSATGALTAESVPEARHAHEWARLHFRAASDDNGVYRYDVRVSTTPITDDASFMAAMSAKQATIEAAELRVPTDAKAGTPITVDMGGLVQQTHYYIAIRAMDGCSRFGPIESTQYTTPKRVFATVSPCFVATAAFGSPMARDVGVLRRFRDRHLESNALGRAAVSAYYAVGPKLADAIRERELLRAAARVVLAPAILLARWLDD